LCACEDKEKKAYELSKRAYECLTLAYELTDQYGSDIYNAWKAGIYDEDELLASGSTGNAYHLSYEVDLSIEDIKDSIAYIWATFVGDDWDSLSEEEKAEYYDQEDLLFFLFCDSLFSACVEIINSGYRLNGTTAQIQAYLDEAKSLMRELSDKYSDYKHYPNLKGYYTTVLSYFEFCESPDGSFSQLQDTLNDYRNDARDFASDLSFVFEDI